MHLWRLARRGGPCRHLWKAFKERAFKFNPLVHLDPLWLADEALLRCDQYLRFTVAMPGSPRAREEPSSAFSWNYAVKLTETAWDEELLRSSNAPPGELVSIHTFPILSQSAPALSKRDLLRKEFHSVLAGIDDQEAAEMLATIRSVQKGRTEKAYNEALCRGELYMAPPATKSGKKRRVMI